MANTLLRLIDHALTEPNPPERDGYKYSYSAFELLADLDITSTDAVSSDLNTDTVHLNAELEK